MTSLGRVQYIGLFCLVLLLLVSGLPLRAQPDVITNAAIFVNFGDIKGESQDIGHQQWVDAIAYSDGLSNAPQAGRAAAGAVFSPVKIVKRIDAASPKLREAAAKGTHLPEVDIEFMRGEFLYLLVRLKEVLVTEVSTTMELPNVAQEVVQLNFGQMEMTYTLQKPDGTAGGNIFFKWSLANNRGGY